MVVKGSSICIYYIVFPSNDEFFSEAYRASSDFNAVLTGVKLAASKGVKEFILENSKHIDIFQGEFK